MNDEHDDLDRALFALPLEPAPPGLREAILRSTIGAVTAPSPMFAWWETAGFGVALALVAWLVLTILTNHTFAATLNADALNVVRALGDPALIAWIACGAALAVSLSFGNVAAVRLRTRSGRS